MSAIRLSVIIPVFNCEKSILESFNSIDVQIDQNYDEILIVDDCSTDGTFDKLKSLSSDKKYVKIYQTKKNSGGPATPRNIGLLNSRGTYIAFCDADDLWIDGKLKKQLALIEDCDLICSEKIIFKDGCLPLKNLNNKVPVDIKKLKLFSFLGINPVANSSVICKKSSFSFLFNESSNYSAIEDYDVWLRMILNGAVIIKLREPLIGYRISKNQISFNKWKMLKKVFCLYKNIFGLVSALILIMLFIFRHLYRILTGAFRFDTQREYEK